MTPAYDSLTLRRLEVAEQLRHYLPRSEQIALGQCAARAIATLREGLGIAGSVWMVHYGGGKDSTYAAAFARALQCEVFAQTGELVTLRVATYRHAGMPAAVFANIDRAYRALGFYDDPAVELLLIEGERISPFHLGDCPPDVRDAGRRDILMSGHRCQGDPRPTFCNRCNLGMENSAVMAIGYGRQADLVLSGDSQSEQKRYLAWVRRASRQMGNAPADGTPGLHTFLRDLNAIGQRLAVDIFGAGTDAASWRLAVDAIPRAPRFFSIFEDAEYRAEDHWELLTDFLGFEFDEIAFSFSESDCGNPGLMAHLQGLRHEHLLGSTYAAGIAEYADYALALMRRKEFPETLIASMARRYATADAVRRMRRRMNEYAAGAFGLSEAQLVCMLYAPFTQGAMNLRAYLAAEQPELAPREETIRRMLSADLDPALEAALASRLAAISGLDLAHLRTLYGSPLVATRQLDAPADNPMLIVLRGDPHKAVISRRSGNGDVVREMISGR
jgi:hypothetical protein